MLRKSIAKMFVACATFLLLAPQTLLTQAKPLEKPASPAKQSLQRIVYTPDAVSLFNLVTASGTPDGSTLKAAVDPMPVQDQTPPRIIFSPSALFLFPPPGFSAAGNMTAVALDQELPYIVAFGSSLAFAGGPCTVENFFAFFDYVLIPDRAEIGIGWITFARFRGDYNFYSVYPCGGLEVVAVDWAGNVADAVAPVIVISF